MDSFRELCTSF